MIVPSKTLAGMGDLVADILVSDFIRLHPISTGQKEEYDVIQFRNPDRSGLRRLSDDSQTRSHSDRRGAAGTRSLPSVLVAS